MLSIYPLTESTITEQNFYIYLIIVRSNNNHLPSSCKWVSAPADGFNYRLCSIGRCRTTVGSFWKNGTVRFTKCNKHFVLARGYDRDVCFNGAWTSTGHHCVRKYACKIIKWLGESAGCWERKSRRDGKWHSF